MSWLSTLLKPAPTEKPATTTGGIRLEENLQHPEIALFASRAVARTEAEILGAPWVAMSFACGYILTDGWNFRDANGVLPTFCPVPPAALNVMQQLVIALQQEKMTGKELSKRVFSVLREIPCLKDMPNSQFEDMCNCTLMRVCYPAPTGAKDDWLTMPAWALVLPSRKIRLM
jgi:hypothetical protein